MDSGYDIGAVHRDPELMGNWLHKSSHITPTVLDRDIRLH